MKCDFGDSSQDDGVGRRPLHKFGCARCWHELFLVCSLPWRCSSTHRFLSLLLRLATKVYWLFGVEFASSSSSNRQDQRSKPPSARYPFSPKLTQSEFCPSRSSAKKFADRNCFGTRSMVKMHEEKKVRTRYKEEIVEMKQWPPRVAGLHALTHTYTQAPFTCSPDPFLCPNF